MVNVPPTQNTSKFQEGKETVGSRAKQFTLDLKRGLNGSKKENIYMRYKHNKRMF